MASNSSNYNSFVFISQNLLYSVLPLPMKYLQQVYHMFILSLLFPYTFFDVSTGLVLLIISLHSPILISYILLSMASPIHLVILQ